MDARTPIHKPLSVGKTRAAGLWLIDLLPPNCGQRFRMMEPWWRIGTNEGPCAPVFVNTKRLLVYKNHCQSHHLAFLRQVQPAAEPDDARPLPFFRIDGILRKIGKVPPGGFAGGETGCNQKSRWRP